MDSKTIILIATAGMLLWAGPVLAGLTNGSFNGLDGWNTSPDSGGFIIAENGIAYLREILDEPAATLSLSQEFTLTPDDNTTLSFDLDIISIGGGETDKFRIYLDKWVSGSWTPVDPISASKPETFYWDSTEGGVTIPNFNRDLTGLVGTSLRLEFQLITDGFPPDQSPISTIAISNVEPTSQVPIVPAPGALILGAIGLGLIAVHKKRILK